MASAAVPVFANNGAISHDDSELITGEAVALDLRPAAFVLRAAGAIVDWIAYAILFVLILFAGGFALAGIIDDAVTAALSIADLAFCIVVVPTTVETLTQGRSLGKLVIGARIVRDDGGAIGFRHAFIRSLLGSLEIFSTLGGLATVVGLLNDRSKRLGDLLAGTYSQQERIPRFVPPVYGVPMILVEWSKIADVGRMPDGLARRLAQFLRQASGLTIVTRAQLARDLANEVALYVSPLPQTDAELFLAAVSAVRRDREYLALDLEKRRLALLQPALNAIPNRFPQR